MERIWKLYKSNIVCLEFNFYEKYLEFIDGSNTYAAHDSEIEYGISEISECISSYNECCIHNFIRPNFVG